MDLDSATEMAQAKLDALAALWDLPLVLEREHVEERPWCWVFPFMTSDSRENIPLGPGPIVVNKDGSEAWLAGSGPLEPQLQAYAHEHGYDESA